MKKDLVAYNSIYERYEWKSFK